MDGPLIFLLIFQVLGAAALGNAIRGLWRSIDGETSAGAVWGYVFFLCFGGIFVCFPFAYSLPTYLDPNIIGLEIIVVVIVFIFSAFWRLSTWRGLRVFFNLYTGLIILGGLFMLSGVLSSFIMLNQGETLSLSLIFGGIFEIIGFAILLLGISNLLRS